MGQNVSFLPKKQSESRFYFKILGNKTQTKVINFTQKGLTKQKTYGNIVYDNRLMVVTKLKGQSLG